MLFILQMYREASSVAPLGPPLTQTPQPSQGAAGAFPLCPWRQHIQSLVPFQSQTHPPDENPESP